MSFPHRLIAILLVAAPLVARAQRLEQPPVPRELVDALLGNDVVMSAPGTISGTKRILIVGKLPDELTGRVYLPPDARILGGAASGVGSTSYYVTGVSRDSLVEAYVREMPKLGWSEAPAQEDGRLPWGFVDPPQSRDLSRRGTVWCRPGTGLVIGIDNGRAERRVGIMAGGLSEYLCQRRDPRASMPRPSWSQYPTLYNPPSNGSQELCVSYSRSGGGMQGQITSPMRIEDVLAHYSRQMLDSGWVAADIPIVARRFTKRDSTLGIESVTEIGVRVPPYAKECREMYFQSWERRIR